MLTLICHIPGEPAARQVVCRTPAGSLGEGWDGYRLDLLGVVRHIDCGGAYFTGNEGNDGPSLRLNDETGILQLDLELWRQRARRQDGPLLAEIHWWPGAPTDSVQDVFRVRVAADKEIGQQDLRAAQRARRQLHKVPLTLNKGGGSKGPRKGQVWSRRQCLEWWDAWVLDRKPRQDDLASALGISDSETAVARWRSTGLTWEPTEAELRELESEG